MKFIASVALIIATSSALSAQEGPGTAAKTVIIPPVIGPTPLPTPIKTPTYPQSATSVGPEKGRHDVIRPEEAFNRWFDSNEEHKGRFKPENDESELEGQQLFANSGPTGRRSN